MHRERPAAAGRPARAPGEVSGGAGRAREARAGGGPVRRSRGVPDASALSGRGPLGPAVRRPHPGPDPGPPDSPTSAPCSPPRRPRRPPLFCSPPAGFRPSLGRRCGRKPPPRTLFESLNGKGAHLSSPGAARLLFAICLSTLLQRRGKKCVSWGGRAKGCCKPSLKTCPREGAPFPGGSPVVLRGLRCHVCCDSALQSLKTFCPA